MRDFQSQLMLLQETEKSRIDSLEIGARNVFIEGGIVKPHDILPIDYVPLLGLYTWGNRVKKSKTDAGNINIKYTPEEEAKFVKLATYNLLVFGVTGSMI
jgi:hypothetical protein